jgi:capsid protein
MSRRSRRLAAQARPRDSAAAVAAPPAAQAATIFQWGGSNGHVAVESTTARGVGYFPELNTKKEITPRTRTEVLRQCRRFTVNCGLARRIVFGLSRLAAGTGLTPYPLTTDTEWNRLALAYAATRFDSPLTFDVGGRFDFYSGQAFALACSYRDGDQATVAATAPTGEAMFAFYEGHQIGDGAGELPAPGVARTLWDGVRVDPFHRAIAYRFLDDDGRLARELPAGAVLFLADYERAGQTRATSIFEHAIPHLHDRDDVVSYLKTGVKLTNLRGFWFEKEIGASTAPIPGLPQIAQTITKSDGTTENITLEQVLKGGQIAALPAGVKLRNNDSAHPHPNQLDFLDYLIRDIAWGAGVAPELLWNIASLGGANTRFVVAEAQSWIDREQEKLIRCWCQPAWTHTIAAGIAAGRLRPCRDPQWWRVGWIPPPRLTVDFGRDGRLYIEQNRSWMLSLKTAYGWSGQDWQVQVSQILDEIAEVKAGLNSGNRAARTAENRNLTWDDVQQFRNAIGFRPDPAGQTTALAEASDGLPSDPAAASAALARLAADPARAEQLRQLLAAQPIPSAD